MFIRFWLFSIKRAVSNILEQRLIHLISMGTITISFLFFGAFVLLVVNMNSWLIEWGQSLSMSVYLEDGIEGHEREQLQKALKALPGAELKGFTSKDEAMEDLREAFGSQAALLDGFKDNPLPASFELVFKEADLNKINPKEIKKDLEKLAGVEEVQYSEQWIERFESILYFIRMGGFVVGGLLGLAVLFITANTIKLTIYARQDEIEIYKLVGATDWFIKAPFLIEGAIQGLLGGLIAIGSLFALYSMFSLKPIHESAIPIFSLVFMPLWTVLGLVGLSFALGLIGGLIAVGRFFNPTT
jgi:cell division transport system permease protein